MLKARCIHFISSSHPSVYYKSMVSTTCKYIQYIYILYTPVCRRMMIPLFVGAETTGRPRWPTEVLENSWQVSWSAPGLLRTPCSIIVFGDTIDSKAQAVRKVADLHYFNGGLLFFHYFAVHKWWFTCLSFLGWLYIFLLLSSLAHMMTFVIDCLLV